MARTDVLGRVETPGSRRFPGGIVCQLWRLTLHAVRILRGLWRRLPVVVTAVLTGTALSAVGTGVSGLFLIANIKRVPSVPWSVPIAAMWLWLYWRYVGGWGWPRWTSQARSDRRRAPALSARAWRWSLWAGGLTIAAFSALGQITERFQEAPTYAWGPLFAGAPAYTLVAIFLMVSINAGVVEESAFRGYMQLPIERRHGPIAGIVIVAVVFTLAHLGTFSHMAPGFFLQFALTSALGYGLLAYVSGSILPGVVLHATLDSVGFVVAVLVGSGDRVPRFSETGPDRLLAIECLNIVILAAIAAWAYRRLLAVKRSDRAPVRIEGDAVPTDAGRAGMNQ